MQKKELTNGGKRGNGFRSTCQQPNRNRIRCPYHRANEKKSWRFLPRCVAPVYFSRSTIFHFCVSCVYVCSFTGFRLLHFFTQCYLVIARKCSNNAGRAKSNKSIFYSLIKHSKCTYTWVFKMTKFLSVVGSTYALLNRCSMLFVFRCSLCWLRVSIYCGKRCFSKCTEDNFHRIFECKQQEVLHTRLHAYQRVSLQFEFFLTRRQMFPQTKT